MKNLVIGPKEDDSSAGAKLSKGIRKAVAITVGTLLYLGYHGIRLAAIGLKKMGRPIKKKAHDFNEWSKIKKRL